LSARDDLLKSGAPAMPFGTTKSGVPVSHVT